MKDIFAAIQKGDLEKVKALLKANPDLVFKTDHADWTPLHYAAHWGKPDIAELLLLNKADVNATGDQRLHPFALRLRPGLFQRRGIAAERHCGDRCQRR